MADQVLGRAVYVYDADMQPLEKSTAAAKGVVDKAGAEMQTSIDRRMATMSKSMGKVGSDLTKGVTLPIIGIGGATVKMAADFNAAMERIHTQSGATQKSVNQLKGEVLDLAKATKFSPTDLADALYRLEGAGLRGARAMTALKEASDLAAVGNAKVEDTAKTVAQVWASGVAGGNNFKKVVGDINATVGTGDLRLQQLVDSLGTGIPGAAKLAGINLNQVLGAIAVFGDQTNNVSGWTAQFATSLHFLTSPTEKAKGALQELGTSATQISSEMNQPRGLLKALTTIRDSLESMPGGIKGPQAKDLLGEIFPGGRGRVMEVLMTQLDRYSHKMTEIQHDSDTFSGDVAKTQQETQYKIQAAWSKIQADAVKLGDALGPDFLAAGEQIANDADKVATAFLKLPPDARNMIITGGLIAAGIGPAMKVASVFLGGVSKLLTAAKLAQGLTAGNKSLFATTAAKTGSTGSLSAVSRVAEMQVAQMTVANATGMPGGVTTSERTAAEVEAGETRSSGSVILPAGTRSVGAAESTAEKVAVPVTEEAGVMTMVKGALSKVAGAGMIAGGGVVASQLVGELVGGKVGSQISTLGTGASIGGGLGMMVGGPVAAGVGAGIGAGVAEAVKAIEGDDYGKKVADSMTKGFGGQYGKNLKTSIASELDAAHKLTTPKQNVSGAATRFGPGNLKVTTTGPSARDVAQATKDYEQAGEQTAQALEKGWSKFKFQNEGTLFSQFDDDVKKLPPRAQAAAADSAIAFATKLESEGRLTAGSTNKFIAQIERQFPGLVKYMGLSAEAGTSAFKKKLDLSDAEKNLNTQLMKMRDDFPQVSKAIDTTTGDAQKKAQNMITALLEVPTKGSAKMRAAVTQDLSKIVDALKNTDGRTSDSTAAMVKALRHIADNGTTPMRKQAASDLDELRSKAVSDFQKTSSGIVNQTATMQKQAASNFHHMQSSATDSTAQIHKTTVSNMGKFNSAVTSAMSNGVLTVGQGMQLIIKNTNAALKQLGQKQLSHIQISEMKGAGAAGMIAGQAATGVSATGLATGGLVQVGKPGAPGRDNLPLNVGGSDIVVGSGEQVVVLNRHQQPIVNRALARDGYTGGLPGLFRSVTTPNYLARGGFVPGFASGGDVSYGQLEGLWDQAGGPRNMAATMAAIAEAESGGNPRAYNSSGASGLWQILGVPFPGDVWNPLTNARMAVSKYESQGLGAWATYTSGAYKQFLQGGVSASALGAVLKQLAAPHVNGTGPWATVAQATLNEVNDAANKYLAAHAPVSAGGGPGTIMATSGKPAAVQAAMMEAASRIIGLPYTYGGGHNDSFSGTPGYDCSGAVSLLLHAAGLLSSPITAGAGGSIMGWGEPGPGKYITVGSRGSSGEDAHMMMSFFGKFLEAGGGGPLGAANVHWDQGWDGSFDIWRHPAGYATGGLVGDLGEVSPQLLLAANPSLANNATFLKAAHLTGASADTTAAAKKKPTKLTPTQKAWAQALKRHHAQTAKARHRGVPPPVNTKRAGKIGLMPGGSMDYGGPILGKDGPMPFKSNDLSPINKLLGSLLTLDGDGLGIGSTSSVTSLGDQMTSLMNWWEAGLGAGGFPGIAEPNFNSWDSPADFVLDDTSSGSDVYSISPNINVVAKQLAQITGMEQSTVTALLQASRLSRQLAPAGGNGGPVWKAIKRRQNAIKAIQKRIRENLKQLKAAQRKLKAYKQDQQKQQARANAASRKLSQLLSKQAKLNKDLTAEQKKKKPDHKKIASLTKQLAPIPGELKRANAVYDDASSRVVGDIAGEQYMTQEVIKPLEHENTLLGGQPSKVGSGGEIGQIAKQMGAAASTNPLSIVTGGSGDSSGLFGVISQAQAWASQLNGPGGDVSAARLQLAEYKAGLAGLLPGANAEAAADVQAAAQSSAGDTTSADTTSTDTTSTLDSLKAQLYDQLQQSGQVSALQSGAFSPLLTTPGSPTEWIKQAGLIGAIPPYGGSFATGGVVPGMPGEPRTIIAHGGEEYMGVGNNSGPIVLEHHTHYSGTAKELMQFVDTRISVASRTSGRKVSYGLPSRGGGR